MALCRQNCSILPEGFEENLDLLFTHLFSQPQALPGDLDRILEALERILPR